MILSGEQCHVCAAVGEDEGKGTAVHGKCPGGVGCAEKDSGLASWKYPGSSGTWALRCPGALVLLCSHPPLL